MTTRMRAMMAMVRVFTGVPSYRAGRGDRRARRR
jgi:hypothetical protein